MKFLDTLNGKASATPPIWMMRQAGRYLPEYRAIRKDVPHFLSLCFNPELAAEVTLQPIRRFDMDAAILFSDILVIPHALGQKVSFVPGKGPQLELFENLQTLKHAPETMNPVFETVVNVRASLAVDKALIGFAGSPWTVITYMLEGHSPAPFKRTLEWLYTKPTEFAELLELITDATITYLLSQIKASADVLQLFDSWANAVPDGYFEQCVIQPTQRIVNAIHKQYPNFPVIGFPRGVAEKAVKYVQQTGIHGISIDQNTSAEWAAESLTPHAVVQGNLDPMLLLQGGDALTQRIKTLKETYAGKPYLFNLGHGIIKETPPEHVQQVVDVLRS